MINSINLNPKTPLELAKIIKNTKCVLLKFGASWCGPCQSPEFKNNFGLVQKEFEKYSKDIKIFDLDIDDDELVVNSTEYYDFKIKSIPHFKFCFEGSIIEEYNGIHCLNDILNNLNKVTQIIETQQEQQSQSQTQPNRTTK